MNASKLALAAGLAFGLGHAAQPKNIILMISDGWGYNQVAAANYYSAGKDTAQAFEKFPLYLPMATWSAGGNGYAPKTAASDATYIKLKPTDSAASGTAFSTGVKTYDAAINVDMDSIPLVTITERAAALGKAAGVVSSVQISHATPASMAAHNVSRNNYAAIAAEMVFRTKLDVIMGAGHPDFNDNGVAVPDTSKSYKYVGGDTTWTKLKAGTAANQEGTWSFIDSKGAFDSLASGAMAAPDRIVGVAQARSTLQQSRSGAAATDTVGQVAFNANVPDLASMSKGALRVLNKNTNGFFLMIEGGAVDWAGHANQSARNIEEQMDFNKAVDSVISWINANGGFEQNLLIVTGDHETGYLTGDSSIVAADSTADVKPVQNRGIGKMPGMQWNSGDHTNQLIPLFAKGPGIDALKATADEWDPVRKYYTRNSEVGQVMFDLWPLPTAGELKVPRYTFLLISDGCGYTCFESANYYQHGKDTSSYMGWNYMPISTFSAGGNAYAPRTAKSDATYVKLKPTDSAASGTAFSAGIKTYDAAINKNMDSLDLKTIVESATSRGLATGSISSVQFSHATPASMAAHNVSRNNYAAIAKEMITKTKLDVIIGAGHPWYNDNGDSLSRDSIDALDAAKKAKRYQYVGGDTLWNDIIAGKAKSGDGIGWTLATTKADFEKYANMTSKDAPEKLLGVAQVASTFQQSRLPADSLDTAGQVPMNDNIPSLATITKAAINTLDRNLFGFFLMVEGGAVDWAGHANQRARMVEEQVDFNNMVDSVVAWVERNKAWDETQIIVTTDHETGYVVGPGTVIAADSTADIKPIVNNGKGKQPGMAFRSGDHTNQLVPFYVKGVNSPFYTQLATEWDPQHGYFGDNAQVGQVLQLQYKHGASTSARPRPQQNLTKSTMGTFGLHVSGSMAMVQLPKSGYARLSLIGIDGKRQATLLNGYAAAGTQLFQIPATQGSALLVLESENGRQVRQVSVLK